MANIQLSQLNDPDWLREQYAKRSLQDIANELGVHRNTVRNRCVAFGIDRRERASHFAGTPKTETQRRKMAEARHRYWQAHPDRETFKAKISTSKTKHGLCNGYRRIYTPGAGRVREHVAVMEQSIGRKLLPGEQVHHINGDKTDNRLENLQLVTNSEHQRIHNYSRPRNPRTGRFTKASVTASHPEG